MLKSPALREIRFRDGYLIDAGDTLIISWPDPHRMATRVEVHHKGRVLTIRASTALPWVGLAVSAQALEEALMDGGCETPNGHFVEPDGVDPDGAPSWLRIHGLI